MTDPLFNIKLDPNKGVPFKVKETSLKRGGKDFRKVLEKEGDNEKKRPLDEKEIVEGKKGKNRYEEVVSQLDAYEQKPSKKTNLSLFTLSEPVKEVEEDLLISVVNTLDSSPEEELPITEFSEEMRNESLSALFQGYGSKEKLNLMQQEANRLSSTLSDESLQNEMLSSKSLASKESSQEESAMEDFILSDLQQKGPQAQESKELLASRDLVVENPSSKGENVYFQEYKEKFDSRFAREQPDLSSINPLAATSSIPVSNSLATTAIQHAGMTAQEIQELVDQIVSKLYTVKTEGKIDTLIALRHPPLFEGTRLVITSYDTAKGEFNLSFENLGPAAKQFMDRQENQDSLRWALEQKGFTVHILTATTLSETSQHPRGDLNPRENASKENGKEEGYKERKQQKEKE